MLLLLCLTVPFIFFKKSSFVLKHYAMTWECTCLKCPDDTHTETHTHTHKHKYAHWHPAWWSMAWVTALENRYGDAQGCSKGKWINAVSFPGNTLFFHSLSQGFCCMRVSGVRAGYYFIMMKGKKCRWEHQRRWQKISSLTKMQHKPRHIVLTTKEKENHVLLLGIVRFGGSVMDIGSRVGVAMVTAGGRRSVSPVHFL